MSVAHPRGFVMKTILGKKSMCFQNLIIKPSLRKNFSEKQYLRGTILLFFPYLPGTKYFLTPLLFENIDTIPKLHGLSTVLDRGHGYSNSLNSAEGCTLPTTNSTTAGKHSRIARRQHLKFSSLIKVFPYANASMNTTLSS